MNFFKTDEGLVFAYDDEQVAQGYGSDMEQMTPEEVETHTNPPPPPKTPGQRLQDSNAAYEAMTRQLTGDYPQLEKDTWATQDIEVQQWIAEPDSALTPWIDRAAAERGLGREDYLRRTIIKAAQFKVMSAFLTGRRQKYEDQIKAGAVPDIDYTLPMSVLIELQRIATTVMATSAEDMQSVTL